MRTAAARADAAPRARRAASRGPARLDALESGTGLVLAVFMLIHTLFASTILLGTDAMATLARGLEGYYVFGRSIPLLVGIVATVILVTFVVHAVLAMRKAPGSWAELVRFRRALGGHRHGDTRLWWWQVITGFTILFLATIHLYTVITNPSELGPFESAEQVWSGRMWPLYLLLLPAVELHVGIGLYRLAMKWGWFEADRSAVVRRRLKVAMWSIIVLYVVLGFASLATYARLGFELARADARPAAEHVR